MLDEQDRVTGYLSNPAGSEGLQENLFTAADPWFNDLPEGADHDGD